MAQAATPYLMIDVAGTRCALPSASAREILPLPHLFDPPTAGGALAGFLNLSGQALPVIDLARLLGLRERYEADPYRHLVVTADGSVALLIDRVDSLIAIALSAISPVESGRTLNGCVAGEIATEGGLVHVLDVDRIMTAEERERLANHALRAQERLATFAEASG